MSQFEQVTERFEALHRSLVKAFEHIDGVKSFREDDWHKPMGGMLSGRGKTRVLENGAVFERAGCGFSLMQGTHLPPTATERNPHLANRPYQVVGVSCVVHPQNPYVPTSHMNVRFFSVEGGSWWFGGGFDLTPFYPFDEDVVAWHRAAAKACAVAGDNVYPILKQNCDRYFYLKHRQETRGVGGVFVDDFNAQTPHIGASFDTCFATITAIGQAFLQSYQDIVTRRAATPFGPRERDFQLVRRGRYVEFNLVFDRGTHFGLQSGGRTESILMSMPPEARWAYNVTYAPDSAEAKLQSYLTPRDWL